MHTLGAGHGYKWNDVDCAVCHQYTCKKGNQPWTVDVTLLLKAV